VSESSDQGRTPVTRQRMRPPPIKNGWPLIVLAVSIVIFMALTLWWTSWWTPGWRGDTEAKLTDTEVMHKLATRMRIQWPQVPGPPTVYQQQAEKAVRTGDSIRAHQRTTMSLALDPEDMDGWIRLVILGARLEAPDAALSVEESAAVLLEVSKLHPEHPELPVAMGWIALRKGETERALSSVGTQPRGLEARLLRLRALGAQATLTDGEAVLEIAPAHGAVCRWTAKRALEDGLERRARAILVHCIKSGADAETGEMLARLPSDAPAVPAENGGETLDSITSVP